MGVKRKATGRASSMPVGLAVGWGISFGLTLILSIIVAKLVDSGAMQESGIGYSAIGILMLSAAAGSAVAVHKIKRQKLAVCAMSAAIYYSSLLAMTALFFGGQYRGMGVTALVVLCGSALVLLPGIRQGRGQSRRRVYKPAHR